jgi:hypothetical protein
MKFKFKQKDVVNLAIAVVLACVLFAAQYYLGSRFDSTLWIFDGILFVLLLVVVMLIADFFVLNALFLVAAELSLLVFLAQAYCAVPQRTMQADQALKSLIVVGLLYIAARFLNGFYKKTKEKYKAIENECWSKEKIFFVTFFLIFTVFFIWQIILVMTPIVSNLCVFKI